MQNHYEVLGVPSNALPKAIKTEYRKLVKVVHPDASGGADAGAFRLVQNAYEVLSNPERRVDYDAELIGATSPTRPPEHDTTDDPDIVHFKPPTFTSDQAARVAAAEERLRRDREGVASGEIQPQGDSHLRSVTLAAAVATLAALILVNSKIYDRIVFWVDDGDLINGFPYERAEQHQPSLGSWIVLTLFVAVPVALTIGAAYAAKLRLTPRTTSAWDVVVAALLTVPAVAVSPLAMSTFGWLQALVLTWVTIVVMWVVGTWAVLLMYSARRRQPPDEGRPHQESMPLADA